MSTCPSPATTAPGNTSRYGVVGVAVALISWLVVLSFLVVVGAVLGAHGGAAAARWRERRAGLNGR